MTSERLFSFVDDGKNRTNGLHLKCTLPTLSFSKCIGCSSPVIVSRMAILTIVVPRDAEWNSWLLASCDVMVFSLSLSFFFLPLYIFFFVYISIDKQNYLMHITTTKKSTTLDICIIQKQNDALQFLVDSTRMIEICTEKFLFFFSGRWRKKKNDRQSTSFSALLLPERTSSDRPQRPNITHLFLAS